MSGGGGRVTKFLLGAGLATFVTALAGAVLLGWGLEEVGVPELLQFTYWLLPFSVSIALAGGGFAIATRGRPALVRVLLAPVLALAAGALSAVAAALLVAPQVPAFRAPWLYGWMLGAMAGVYVALGGLWRRRTPAEPR